MAATVVDVNIKIDEVMERFQAMENTGKEGSKAFRKAFRKALAKIRRGVISAASTVTSNKEKQRLVKLTAYKSGLGGNVRAWQGGYLKNGRYFNLKWLEDGTKEGKGKNGRMHGATPAKPFFWQGVNSSIDEALEGLEEDIMDELVKAYNKR